MILSRASYLPDRDRLLIEAVFREGRSVTDLSALTGEPARSLRRRVRRIIQRVGQDRFVFVVHHMDKWTPTRRRVAQACVLAGRSLRSASHDLSLSLYSVRRHTEAIDAQMEATRR